MLLLYLIRKGRRSQRLFDALGQENLEEDTDDSWREILTYDNQGKCEKTISNICLILENDLISRVRYFLMSLEIGVWLTYLYRGKMEVDLGCGGF